jgi:hypothetical protein
VTDSTPATAALWQRCHSCGKTWLRGHSRERDPDIKRLTYTSSDGVKCSSYPMCAEHRPEQTTRLERMGFTDIEAVPA